MLSGGDVTPATDAYAKDKIGVAAALDKAGRQRMLSQRLATLYLFRLWGAHAQTAETEFNMARAEFASGMHQLSVNPTPLAKSRRNWKISTANRSRINGG